MGIIRLDCAIAFVDGQWGKEQRVLLLRQLEGKVRTIELLLPKQEDHGLQFFNSCALHHDNE
jgi:hypothetical protein